MDWLLFFNSEDCANKIRMSLKKQDVHFVDYDAKIDNVSTAKFFLNNVTGIVIEKDFFAATPGMTSFIAGYIIGKNINIVAVDSKKEGELYSLLKECSPKNAICDMTRKNLSKEFDALLAKLQEEDKKNLAYSQLFEEGRPFCADCFAHYIRKEDIDVCNLYIQAGFDLDEKTSLGVPLLCEAVRTENMKMVDILIACGADINALSGDRGFSPIMDAVWKKNTQLVKKFVDLGARLDFIGKDGMPILVLAVGTGNVEVCKILAEHGADFNIVDAMGMSALSYAKLFHQDEIVKIFEAL